MLNENAKKWVKALRSGKYQQITGALATTNGEHCVLGVAIAVAIRNGLKVKVVPNYEEELVYFDNQDTDLPKSVRDWLGLRTNTGIFTPEDGFVTRSLMGLNDTGWEADDRNPEPVSFAELADIIEQEPKGLFKKPARKKAPKKAKRNAKKSKEKIEVKSTQKTWEKTWIPEGLNKNKRNAEGVQVQSFQS